MLDISRDQSAANPDALRLLPIIGERMKREIVTNVNCGSAGDDVRARKDRDGSGKKKKRQRERRRGRDKERGVNTERHADIKRVGKSEPLTRHARRPQRSRCRGPIKGAGANRTRSRHRSHERRNLEKQYLVRNRTLELLERQTSVNARDVLFGRRKTPEKLGDVRKPPSLRITDLLIPAETFLDPESKKESNQTADSINKKLKTIALNVSRINKAVQRNPSNEYSGDSGYRLNDYEDVFEDPSVSPWVNPPKSEPPRDDEEYFLDKGLLTSVYMPIDEQITLHRGLATLLSRLFQSLTNNTDDDNQELLQELDFDNSVQGDLCQKWLDCKDKLEEAFLGETN